VQRHRGNRHQHEPLDDPFDHHVDRHLDGHLAWDELDLDARHAVLNYALEGAEEWDQDGEERKQSDSRDEGLSCHAAALEQRG
jgi:hypothetical protein